MFESFNYLSSTVFSKNWWQNIYKVVFSRNEKSRKVAEYQYSVISDLLSFVSLTLSFIWLLQKFHSAIHSGLWHRHMASTVVTSYSTTRTVLVIFNLCWFSHIVDMEDLRVLNHVFYICLDFGKRIPAG